MRDKAQHAARHKTRYRPHADIVEGARFFCVAMVGMVLDLAVAWSVVRLFNLPLWLAAAQGFAVAAAANYALHELWTFRAGARRLSVGRALRYSASLAATLGARLGSVIALAALIGDAYPLPVLLAGAVVSFLVNYLISKHFVFCPNTRLTDSAP